ncbi:MAG: YkyA family protein [Bacillaceae bacterium]|nr:YkyA family protein [Bacillaceae bacterium]
MRVIIILIFALLTACSQGPTAAEQMYEHLEKAVDLEENFAAQQEPLLELERQEKELYDKIIQMSSSEFEESVKLSEEAIDIIEQRRDIMDIEKESIEAAKTEFDKVKPMIEELEDENVKEIAGNMIDAMENRFQSYQDLYESYMKSLDLNKELYLMLQNEDLTKEKLENQIDQINNSYDEIMASNKQFNDFTKTYNNLKMEFYQSAGINIQPADQLEQENNNNE